MATDTTQHAPYTQSDVLSESLPPLQIPQFKLEKVDTMIGPISYIPRLSGSEKSPVLVRLAFYAEILARGTAIGISKYEDYNPLWVAFHRFAKKKKLKTKLCIRQVAESLWLVIPIPAGQEPPPAVLFKGGQRRYGRFQYYLTELERGVPLMIADRNEAVRIKRAWNFRYPKEKRGDRRCEITYLSKNRRYVVAIAEEAG